MSHGSCKRSGSSCLSVMSPEAQAAGVPARDDRRPRWRAIGHGAVHVGKPRAASGQLIEIGGLDDWIARTAQRVVMVLVGHEEQHVQRAFLGPQRRRTTSDNRQHEEPTQYRASKAVHHHGSQNDEGKINKDCSRGPYFVVAAGAPQQEAGELEFRCGAWHCQLPPRHCGEMPRFPCSSIVGRA